MCDVSVFDRSSMRAHIAGRPHLAMKQKHRDSELRQRFGKGLAEVMQTDPDHFGYDENFWARESSGSRSRREEIARQQENSHYSRTPVKFDKATYDFGQFNSSSDELYCADCDVRTLTRDQMQCHKNGQTHKKRTTLVKVYSCELCYVTVPCQDTLDNHKRGKSHLKRVQELEDQRRRSGEYTGPGLSRSEVAELELLRVRASNQQRQLATLRAREQACIRDHHQFLRLQQEMETLKAIQERDKRELERTKEEKLQLQQRVAKLELKNAKLRSRLSSSTRASGSPAPCVRPEEEEYREVAHGIPGFSLQAKKEEQNARDMIESQMERYTERSMGRVKPEPTALPSQPTIGKREVKEEVEYVELD